MVFYFMKVCTRCKQEKEISDFHKQKNGKYGVAGRCKSCKCELTSIWQKSNKEKKIIYNHEYNKNNKIEIKKRKRDYRQNNKEYIKESINKNPLMRFKRNLRSNIRMSIKGKGYTKKSKTFDILGVDFETFKKHIERQFKKGMGWSNHGEWHLDHIIPIALAETEKEAIKLNHYTNFQPLWAKENLEKHTSIVESTQTNLRL